MARVGLEVRSCVDPLRTEHFRHSLGLIDPLPPVFPVQHHAYSPLGGQHARQGSIQVSKMNVSTELTAHTTIEWSSRSLAVPLLADFRIFSIFLNLSETPILGARECLQNGQKYLWKHERWSEKGLILALCGWRTVHGPSTDRILTKSKKSSYDYMNKKCYSIKCFIKFYNKKSSYLSSFIGRTYWYRLSVVSKSKAKNIYLSVITVWSDNACHLKLFFDWLMPPDPVGQKKWSLGGTILLNNPWSITIHLLCAFSQF